MRIFNLYRYCVGSVSETCSITARASVQQIVSAAAQECIVTGISVECIFSSGTFECIVAVEPFEHIVVIFTFQSIGKTRTDHIFDTGDRIAAFSCRFSLKQSGIDGTLGK